MKPIERIKSMKQLSNHTPGPWHVGMRPGPIVYGALGEQIAGLRGSSLGYEETSANARLIASAPELLAALEIVLSSTCGDVGDDGYDGCIRIEAKALERVRAAIAKATREI
jgi:hypothetical protein